MEIDACPSEAILDLSFATLVRAALESDLDGFKKRLEKADPFLAKSYGTTLLKFACMNKAHGKEIAMHAISVGLITKLPVELALGVRNFEVAEAMLKMRTAKERSILQYAVYELRDASTAKVIAKHKPELLVGLQHEDEMHPFEFALSSCGVDMVQWMLECGVVDQESLKGHSPLHHAAANVLHGVDIIEYLVDKYGCDVNEISDKFVGTPVFEAFYKDNLAVAKKLINDHKVALVLEEKRLNALLYCIENSKILGVRLLLDTKDGSDMLNMLDQDKTLQLAIKSASKDLVKLLWREGMDYPDEQDGWNPLCYVGFNKKHGVTLARYFIGQDYCMNKCDVPGDSPVVIALREENYPVVEELLKLDAKLIVQPEEEVELFGKLIVKNKRYLVQKFYHNNYELINQKWNGMSAFQLSALHGNLDLCCWLVSRGSQDAVLSPHTDRKSLLHLAMQNIHGEELITFLVATLKVDVNAIDADCRTPLHYALLRGRLDIAQQLIDIKADLKIKMNDLNMLHFCALANALQSGKFVLEHDKEQLKELAYDDMTALHLAAMWSNKEFCQMLVQNGVDKEAVALGHYTAKDLVRQNDQILKDYFTELFA